MKTSSLLMLFEGPPRSRLGLTACTCAIRRKWLQQPDPKSGLFEPLVFLKHCHSVGAGGIQVSIGVFDTSQVNSPRNFAVEHSLQIDGIANPPKDEADLARRPFAWS
jgi:hypothetical protein